MTTNYNNLDFSRFVKKCNTLLKGSKDEKLKDVFKESKIVLGLKQPNNLKQILMPTTISTTPENGLFKCYRPNCNICTLYLQECKSFTCSNGSNWEIKCRITCRSKCVIYYLKCNMCDVETYTGITNDLRLRTNNHIHCIRKGTGTDIFDRHAYECGNINTNLREPYFKLYAFMSVNTESKLLLYERLLHNKKLDTLNS